MSLKCIKNKLEEGAEQGKGLLDSEGGDMPDIKTHAGDTDI